MPNPSYSPDRLTSERLAVSPSEGALLAGIGRTKFYQLLNAGVVPSFKIGARRLVRVAEIEAWLLRLEGAARARQANVG
jgi:excisionase family DNA binding protein